jgi:hypothetical protein
MERAELAAVVVAALRRRFPDAPERLAVFPFSSLPFSSLPFPALDGLIGSRSGQAAGLWWPRQGSPASILAMSARVHAGQMKVTVRSGACALLQARPRVSSAARRRPQPGQGGPAVSRGGRASIHRGWRSTGGADHLTRAPSACRNVPAASR